MSYLISQTRTFPASAPHATNLNTFHKWYMNMMSTVEICTPFF